MTRALAIAVLAASVGVATDAGARPPVPGSERDLMLQPYAGWIGSVFNTQSQLCCSIADAWIVDTRVRGNRYEVKFPAEAGAGTDWLPVADSARVLKANPVAVTLAWWYGGEVRCLALPGGV